MAKPLFNKLLGKGDKSETLPNQHTLSKLVHGDTFERSINNYAKVTPSGESALDVPNVEEMGNIKF